MTRRSSLSKEMSRGLTASRITSGLPAAAIGPKMHRHLLRPPPKTAPQTDPASRRGLPFPASRRPGPAVATSRSTLSP